MTENCWQTTTQTDKELYCVVDDLKEQQCPVDEIFNPCFIMSHWQYDWYLLYFLYLLMFIHYSRNRKVRWVCCGDYNSNMWRQTLESFWILLVCDWTLHNQIYFSSADQETACRLFRVRNIPGRLLFSSKNHFIQSIQLNIGCFLLFLCLLKQDWHWAKCL